MSLRITYSSLLVLIVGLLMDARPAGGAIFDLDGNVLYPDIILDDGVDLSGLDLRRAQLAFVGTGVSFRNADLTGARLNGAEFLGGADFRGAILDFVDAGGDAKLDGSNFLGASMNGIDLSHSSVRFATFGPVDFGVSGMSGTIYANHLKSVDFTGSDLSGAKLSGADLAGVNFDDAILVGADLSGAYLRGAAMVNADVRYANFQQSGWDEQTIYGNDFRFSDLRGAVFYSARDDRIFDPDNPDPFLNDFRGAIFDEFTGVGADSVGSLTELGMVFVSSVPEPTTMGLLAGGLAGLLIRRATRRV